MSLCVCVCVWAHVYLFTFAIFFYLVLFSLSTLIVIMFIFPFNSKLIFPQLLFVHLKQFIVVNVPLHILLTIVVVYQSHAQCVGLTFD